MHSDAPSQKYNFVFPGLNKNMKAHVRFIFKIEIFKIKTSCCESPICILKLDEDLVVK